MKAQHPAGKFSANSRLHSGIPVRCGTGLALMLACAIFIVGCAAPQITGDWKQLQSSALRDRLLQLDSRVNAGEATRLADAAVEQASVLADQYRPVRPPWLGNYFVNWGLRDRGLCYDWANSLYPHLHNLGAETLELHLAVARMDTSREHNAIVVTARGQQFAEGVVLDAWRGSGRLWFGNVSSDKYPWQPLPRDRVPAELQSLVGQ